MEPTPSPGAARWIILLLTCGGLFGQFYAFDNPSALNEQMQQDFSWDSQFQYHFNLLYSVYSFPNVLLPLAMGLAVDWCGYRSLICALGFCVVLGHAMVSLGAAASSWPLMIAGRIVFGLGGESMQVAQSCLLLRWFKGKEVAFALGVNLSVARAGSVLNDVVSPWAASRWGVSGALWLGTGLCVLSFASNIASTILDKSEGIKAGLSEAPNEEEVSIRDVLKLRKQFWFLAGLCVAIYCAILPFNNIASAYFVETSFAGLPLAEAQQRAGNVMSILFLVSAVGTPPFGVAVDLVGMRSQFLLGCGVLLTFTYTAMPILPPAVSMLCLGAVYTVFAGALWPAFALVVAEKQLGTAYGVATALQNTGLAITPLVVGHLQTSAGAGSFGPVMHLFSFLGAIGTAFAVLIYHTNKASHGVLDLPSEQAALGAAKLHEEEALVAAAHSKEIVSYL